MSNTDIRENKPWKTNQIETEKPAVETTETILTGFTGGSFNAGHNKTIHYRQVMAGQKVKQAWWEGSIKLLTPKTVSYQNLICTARSYFVPNDRVMKDYLKFAAYKGGSSEEKIEELPNLRGKTIPIVEDPNSQLETPLDCTAQWRDTIIGSYLPRTSLENTYDSGEQEVNPTEVAPMSVLALRGRIAIFNDKERNKMYEEPLEEFTESNTVSQREWESYLPNTRENYINLKMRATANNSYYTNYRTEIQGIESLPPENNPETRLVEYTNWENLTDFARTTVNDSEKNDWDILAELRGSKKALEGKVQLIGKHSFVLNYNSITQSTYNNKSGIQEEYQVMGAQGGYSYTYVKIPLYAGQEFNQDGYIHTIFTISADTVYTNAYPRMELNIGILDRYRPDLKEQKLDVLYESECGVIAFPKRTIDWGRIYGYKRKFSEYFKLDNCVNGDIINNFTFDYKGADISGATSPEFGYDLEISLQPQNTYTFFETTKDYSIINWGGSMETGPRKIWKDYSDIQINKNLAIPAKVIKYPADEDGDLAEYVVTGNNQAVYIGKIISEDILPIDSDIKRDFTEYGEH